MRQLVIPRWGLWLMFLSSVVGSFLLATQLLSGRHL
jgi:hypothetical protein